MNPCSKCFLLVHLSRQEANFYWSVWHSAAIHVTTKTDREQWEGQHISEKKMCGVSLKRAGKENKQQAGGWPMRNKWKNVRDAVLLYWEMEEEREVAKSDVRIATSELGCLESPRPHVCVCLCVCAGVFVCLWGSQVATHTILWVYLCVHLNVCVCVSLLLFQEHGQRVEAFQSIAEPHTHIKANTSNLLQGSNTCNTVYWRL